MNNIFIGSHTKEGLIYDYSGIWSRRDGKVQWKAVVRNADVVCRPSGVIEEPEGDLEDLLKDLVLRDIELAVARR